MTNYQIEAAQQLRAFTAYIRGVTSQRVFENRMAVALWTSLKPYAERQLLLLEQAAPSLKLLDYTEFQRFLNILKLSQKTLKWAEPEELTLVEALCDVSKVLLKRLRVAHLIVESKTETDFHFLKDLPHTTVKTHWRATPNHLNSSEWFSAARIQSPIQETESSGAPAHRESRNGTAISRAA